MFVKRGIEILTPAAAPAITLRCLGLPTLKERIQRRDPEREREREREREKERERERKKKKKKKDMKLSSQRKVVIFGD